MKIIWKWEIKFILWYYCFINRYYLILFILIKRNIVVFIVIYLNNSDIKENLRIFRRNKGREKWVVWGVCEGVRYGY